MAKRTKGKKSSGGVRAGSIFVGKMSRGLAEEARDNKAARGLKKFLGGTPKTSVGGVPTPLGNFRKFVKSPSARVHASKKAFNGSRVAYGLSPVYGTKAKKVKSTKKRVSKRSGKKAKPAKVTKTRKTTKTCGTKKIKNKGKQCHLSAATGFCMKCRAARTPKGGFHTVTKKGRSMLQGKCNVCGTVMTKFTKGSGKKAGRKSKPKSVWTSIRKASKAKKAGKKNKRQVRKNRKSRKTKAVISAARATGGRGREDSYRVKFNKKGKKAHVTGFGLKASGKLAKGFRYGKHGRIIKS